MMSDKKNGKPQTTTQSKTIAGEHCAPMLHYLLHRRSISRKDLVEPGPTAGEVQQILQAASRVPDHGKMFPYWFIVFEGASKDAFADRLTEIMAQDEAGKDRDKLRKKASKLLSSPLVIAVVAGIRPSKIPAWEQMMSVGAACQNLVLAANALGYGVNWLTEWMTYDDRVKQALHLDEGENIAGFFYIGTAEDVPDDRDRPVLDDIVTYWHNDNTVVNKGQAYAADKRNDDKAHKGFMLNPVFED